MNNQEFVLLAINLHTRTVLMMLAAIERADTDAARHERIKMLRECVESFKADCNKYPKEFA